MEVNTLKVSLVLYYFVCICDGGNERTSVSYLLRIMQSTHVAIVHSSPYDNSNESTTHVLLAYRWKSVRLQTRDHHGGVFAPEFLWATLNKSAEWWEANIVPREYIGLWVESSQVCSSLCKKQARESQQQKSSRQHGLRSSVALLCTEKASLDSSFIFLASVGTSWNSVKALWWDQSMSRLILLMGPPQTFTFNAELLCCPFCTESLTWKLLSEALLMRITSL